MKVFTTGQAAFIAACLAWILTGLSFAQVPRIETQDDSRSLEQARQWESINSVHVARQILKGTIEPGGQSGDNADIAFEIIATTFNDQDYKTSYFQAATFRSRFPSDSRRSNILFIEGVSAFQAGKIDSSLNVLTMFVTETPSHPLRGLAHYWRARCRLEQRDWLSAESDFRQCAQDTLSHTHRDDALLGWSLALERRGEFSSAMEIIQRLLNEHPQSELLNDARIRLASLNLRLDNARNALVILQETKTPYRYLREESLLLRAEANFQMELFDSARVRYERFIKDFPQSIHIRNARYGLAWTNLRLGNTAAAQEEFDMLGRGTDTLAITAMYQSAIISLLQNNTKDATARLDSFVLQYPYEQFSDNAYVQLGMIAYRAQRYKEARKYFQLAARLYPESELRFSSYRLMGEASLALSDFSNAQYAFGQIRKSEAPDSVLAPSMFQECISLYHLGRFKTSAERFGDFLKKFPNHPLAAEGYVWRGEALYQDYRFDEAERAYAEALRLFPGNRKRQDASYGVAWSLFEQKKFSRAIEAFDQFVKSYPQSKQLVEASLRKADCYFFLGDYTKSEELYASLASEKSSGEYAEYAAFQIALSYIQRGDAERGIEHLRNFLNRFPSSIYNEVVQFNIAWTYFSKEQFKEALQEFQTFLRHYPESQLLPRVFFNMGDAYYNTSSYDSARIYYTNVLEQFPQTPLAADALSGLEYTYRAEGRGAEALSLIEKYINTKQAGANQEELLLRKADIIFDQGDFPAAIQEYQKVLSMKPDHTQQAKALQQIGRAYELENNPAQAITYYEQIVTTFSDVEAAPSVALALGLAYVKIKQFTQANEIFKSFDLKFPNSPFVSEARYQQGITLFHLKDSVGAYNQFQFVVSRHPDDIFAERCRLQLAKFHQRKKQYQASLDTLEGVISRRNDDLAAEALLVMGEDYLLMKRNGDALQAFLDVVEQYTEFSLLVERAKLGAAESYIRLHEKTKAKMLYQEIINSPVDPEMKIQAQQRLRKLQ